MFAKNFRVAAAMKTSVLLSWEVPDSYKSAVPFRVGEARRAQDTRGPLWALVSVPARACAFVVSDPGLLCVRACGPCPEGP